MISLNYIRAIDLCVLCVFVVRFTRSRVAIALRPPAGLYLRIHFTHQAQESHGERKEKNGVYARKYSLNPLSNRRLTFCR
ncbi:MAG: hypothetical protein EWV53_05725 [Microcystis panniformis Mp_MB_F_20051200_S9]|uniref:Uncharacterized protein n=1 Tax=Microcystis panniformis Mp_MB_F_20051200_S9 TaxID=2486223 RepID=A0A552Q6I8_9CHRO|nr:MAG: hypothetical protein EWV43_21630 [Microcystis panniformis Mp_MB_F_20080800_S26D]TRV46274.1 MAG: hypothetical protein EWV42_18525 [Microcystis panniformis Mp_GB_SS_20050300_S99D]TRV49882.1 MAG: hypothetical protein EWV87_09465 [Microcystis panniformis Mp_GB_SS_20050300_S99]TRV59818.1 MAG: hypothetical protein EWV69_10945 [Microcystis panniformis Mp_MB_F_20080800_S26]TRV64789.1 MAG: hypothetical protein EWV53_05725 [Microcystis panniformis Mp_MB_F_20051200_S9]TRV65198.1 MAG: hypothetical